MGADTIADGLGDNAASRAGDLSRLGDLARLIETEVIPRMLIAHATASGEALARLSAARDRLNPGFDVDLVAALALEEGSGGALERHVAALADVGVPPERICLELLAPAARRLGEMWDYDLISFVDVTLGLGRLQRALHGLDAARPRGLQPAAPSRRVLVASAPGEQHTFGAAMLGDLFARAGWRASLEIGATSRDLVRVLKDEAFDLVALSASGEAAVARLPALIRGLRRASRNRRLMVMVGGQPFTLSPELCRRVGADATAADAAGAVAMGERLLDLAARVD